ncbi:MAG: polyribonucleotide nucleotidyltransferase [Candidatus Terrybacteria bacterium RIFCSPHIGHO2_01_FULL_48_17]|uniref:Polyribonucleotide nucleotidyltransferase n=1 Tax=Candidatus Terrybacteria bacterium RIFCSPHIGHO2_01_FULL_48_17 TaxID=1802362 RepID=A0A1G2PK58_9BACT|nr:MAG: polyribonucleotide nucleotidyltransferase [Candidatus Terrybacteria bacterium RIFCSPHIGHO2_01_FULL_48_17]OHA51903.1 MAG: polyribonucleotide nucleotidyltransferase [Candidatus Terrybacteria bacterium RIFCSPLOWO2_01_FULL_48_14]
MSNRLYSYTLPHGVELQISFPGYAEQANAETLVRLGDTVILVTTVMKDARSDGVGFFPLTVEFEEKFYAAGELRTSRFVKREAKPSDEAILAARLIDRTIRPRFPKGMRNEVQVVATTLSYDGENDPDILGILGASIALSCSDIPWHGPIAGVRVAKPNGTILVNPTVAQRAQAKSEIVIAGTKNRINMMEAGLNELSHQEALTLIADGHKEVQKLCTFIENIVKEQGKPKVAADLFEPPRELVKNIRERFGKELKTALFEVPGKVESQSNLRELEERAIEEIGDEQTSAQHIREAFENEINRVVHEEALENGRRADGRKKDEVRILRAQAGVLPRTHGSSVFVRGTTRALATVTLAGPGEQQLVETMEGEWKKNFMLHYNFPPFSVGDIKPFRGPGRREIGHGALAERAISPLIPDRETFPYTIRVVSEILSSNGSSSMASVCAGTLSLMDAGVPLKKPVAGIAMGLMMEQGTGDGGQGTGKYLVLTDIQGPEDHHGDMDLKVAGTKDGFTALQMDVKIEGVTLSVIEETFAQARNAIDHILKTITDVLPAPRPSVGPYAPKVLVLKINPDRIRDVIGPGGRVINTIIEETGATIDVEQDGTVYVTSIDEAAAQKALAWVRNLTREIMPGEEFEGKVSRIFPFGVMLEIMPDKEGLIHVSALERFSIRHPGDAFKPGQVVPVVVKEIDDQGRVNLALKEGYQPEVQSSGFSRPPLPPRPHHGGPRRGFGGNRQSRDRY